MTIFNFLRKKELEEIRNLKGQLEKYQSIIDLDHFALQKEQEIRSLNDEKVQLTKDYREGLSVYQELKKKLSLYESNLEIVEYGIYEPIYDFDKSDQYREKLSQVVARQKELIKFDQAATCTADWSVEGSVSKGKAITTKFKKLMLRAFNGESSSLIAKVKWNNVVQMKERLRKSYDDINKLGEGFRISLNLEYLNLKEDELTLEYEYQLKRQHEKEEMRAIQEELREEEKARREFEQAQRDAEKQEGNFLKALEKAKSQLSNGTNADYDRLINQIELLEVELAIAREKKERAISMAQQTKRGHVYIISNIGSFGENVFKIGMTRRLEPLDRVRELGDASVPFKFDVHAMIYSDEARTLEYQLHHAFSDKKINMLNYRREFFNVTLEEIESKISELGFSGEFSSIPEAMEFRETILLKDKAKEHMRMALKATLIESDEFPKSLF